MSDNWAGHRLAIAALAWLAAGAAALAADGFEKVRCDAPIIPALVGARTSNERVVVIEARRQALGLKDLGADQIADTASTINWRICGREFALLNLRNITRDAVEIPAHNKASPAFSGGACTAGGKAFTRNLMGVLGAGADRSGKPAPALAVWSIDDRNGKFVKLPDGAICSGYSLITADGGL